MGARFGTVLIVVMALAVGIGLIAARSQPQSVAAPVPTATATPLPTPASGNIDIETNPSGTPSGQYVPSTKTVRVGEKVVWVNADTVDHSVLFDSGRFNSGVLGPGERASWTAVRPGRFTYGDFLHPDIHGVIVVLP